VPLKMRREHMAMRNDLIRTICRHQARYALQPFMKQVARVWEIVETLSAADMTEDQIIARFNRNVEVVE